ncbi:MULTISPECIES: anticodon nuclease [unclassified Gilliamella]|uniref:anticodon nuclease n=1 Tax=unclassified Gilliamella TaxID=2685620 RepID=UPI00132311AD|nr:MULTISPECIES: anticodon nuclease [unclassified Gilliamella]MWN32069.1 anticodon nuclease [Gilliamella sp. Pra-s60]MWP29328.1 anticodon nuclease [Gilliamella sp. Pra-s54]
MNTTLRNIAEKLDKNNKKIQLIYAFNGTGKTRLSQTFKNLIISQHKDDKENNAALTRHKILYYNAFTEDLFAWDNDKHQEGEHQLIIQPNSFTDWILKDQGQDQNIIRYFQSYTHQRLLPHFNEDFSAITFSLAGNNDQRIDNIKISKGEENNLIWSIFFTLINLVIAERNITEKSERSTNEFDHLRYIFIDDPVSSLDENHLIQLAVDIAQLIKSSEFKSSKSDIKFIITTHNPLFYNVLYNELDLKKGYILRRFEDGKFALEEKKGDSNHCFSYHLYLKDILQQAINEKKIEKYHFTLLRNLYEKTACFLGYQQWSELLPDNKQAYLTRIINFTSHSKLSNEMLPEPSEPEKQIVAFLLNHLLENYNFKHLE